MCAEQTTEQIDKCFQKLFYLNDTEKLLLHVHCVCDEFVKPKELKTLSIELLQNCQHLLVSQFHNETPIAIANHCKMSNVANINTAIQWEMIVTLLRGFAPLVSFFC